MTPDMKLMNVVLLMKVKELYMIVGMSWKSNEEHVIEASSSGCNITDVWNNIYNNE